MAAPPQQFCVRWNSYQSNLQNAFPKLLTSEHFVDVTLACENEMLKCHKVVLSACSTYFEKLLLDNPCQHPIVFMKDMRFQEMQSLVDFMYKGEVNVTQDDLPSLLKSAEALQIRGLCGSDQLLNQPHFGAINKPPVAQPQLQQIQPKQVPSTCAVTDPNHTNKQLESPKQINEILKKEKEEKSEAGASSESGHNASGSESDSNDGIPKEEQDAKDDMCGEDDSYFDADADGDLMDTEFLEEDGPVNTHGDMDVKTPEFAIANVSCQYDGSPGSASTRRIRRSDEELRRAAECITRGQTFQTVSDQFNIPISTIRFYMARKGILPRRKRGRACSGPTGMLGGMPVTPSYNPPGNTSPIGPPYHIVHYKLPALGVSKLK